MKLSVLLLEEDLASLCSLAEQAEGAAVDSVWTIEYYNRNSAFERLQWPPVPVVYGWGQRSPPPSPARRSCSRPRPPICPRLPRAGWCSVSAPVPRG